MCVPYENNTKFLLCLYIQDFLKVLKHHDFFNGLRYQCYLPPKLVLYLRFSGSDDDVSTHLYASKFKQI